MLYRREGFPESDELILCTVTKIFSHSVFVNLDEYDKGGMVHISEIAPGRIRNIRDYVVAGKKIVCKILRVNREKGHIDLSLRRVNEAERKKKIEEIKQEQKAEKLIENVSKEINVPVSKIYDEVTARVFEHYLYLFGAFKDIAEGKVKPSKFKLSEKISKHLIPLIEERFQPQKVEIKGSFTVSIYKVDGVEILKKAFAPIEDYENVTVVYLGGGRYQIRIVADDYKSAEATLKKLEKKIVSFVEKNEGKAVFSREKS